MHLYLKVPAVQSPIAIQASSELAVAVAVVVVGDVGAVRLHGLCMPLPGCLYPPAAVVEEGCRRDEHDPQRDDAEEEEHEDHEDHRPATCLVVAAASLGAWLEARLVRL